MVGDGFRPMCPGLFVLFCGITLSSFTGHWSCAGLSEADLYPYNISTDRTTPNIDDGGSGKIKISTTFNFFDKAYNTVYVSNNGIISFNAEFSDRYQPESFPINGTALVAPFWADVDIEKVPDGSIWFGENNDTKVLQRASCDIRSHFPQYNFFRATWVFVSTWHNVGFYGAADDGLTKRNTFQAVLITDGNYSFVMFNYLRIEWTTGKNSDGNATTGLGGVEAQVKVHVLTCTICQHRPATATCARSDARSKPLAAQVAGYNAECCNRSKDVFESGKESVINLTRSSNVGLPGRQLFELFEPSDVKGRSSRQVEMVKVSPTSGSMLGGEKLTVSGVCFPRCCSVIRAVYVEWNVTFRCRKVNWDRAECVLPSVFRIGKVTLRFTQDYPTNCDRLICGQDFNVSTSFSIYNFIRVSPKVERVNPAEWVSGSNISVKWRTAELGLGFVELAVLGYNPSGPSWEVLDHRGKMVKSESSESVGNLKLNYTGAQYSTCIVRVAKLRSQNMGCGKTKSLQDCAVKAIWSDIFAVNFPTPDFSQRWCRTWIDSESNLARSSPLPEPQACPTIYILAKNDIAHFQMDPFCDFSGKLSKPSCHYTSQVKACFRLVSPLGGGDQVCCYGDNGDLISADDLSGWGTQQRYHFDSRNSIPTLQNFEQDILPSLHCRYFSEDSDFRLHYDRLRPKSTTKGYSPPKPAQCAGDPHIVTLDERKYTFNGIGEFVFLQDTERKCVIQIRTTQAKDTDNQKQDASIIDTVVMGGEGKKQIEVQRLSQGAQHVGVLVDGVGLDLSSPQDISINGLSLSIKRQGTKVTSVLVVFDNEGLSVDIEPTPYLLNVLLIVGSKLKGKLEGLLGNYNGNSDDDFTTRDGKKLSAKPTDQEIHESFGLSWAITAEESLFTYPEGMGTADFTNTTFRPYFLDDLEGQFTETEIEICGLENTECLFDFKTTKNEEIANQTKKFVKMFENIVKETKPVTRCLFPPDIGNTTKNFTGLSVNATVEYSCVNSSEPAQTMVCRADGTWTGPEVTCVKVLQPSELPVLLIAIISAAGTVVLISVVTVTAVMCKRRTRKKKPDPQQSIELEEFDMFKNEAFWQELRKLPEDGPFKLPRPFLEDPKLYTEYF